MTEKAEVNTILLITLSFLVVFFTNCGQATEEQTRKREKFNSRWKFTRGDIENAQAYNFDDYNWRNLDLPHDWAIEGPFSKKVYFQGGFLPYPGVNFCL